MVIFKLKYNFVETPRTFTIAELLIINLRGVSTKLYFNIQMFFRENSTFFNNQFTKIKTYFT